jgi:hypothetical protein
MKTFLCLIIDRNTGDELAEHRPDAAEAYYAKNKAARMFENDQKYQPNLRRFSNWYVDAVEL